MGVFRRKKRNHLISIHPHNVGGKDWLILLEANTIVGASTDKLRVAPSDPRQKDCDETRRVAEQKAFPCCGGIWPANSRHIFLPATLYV